MPTRDHYSAGVPSWADLMSPDVDASKDFYTRLFGWDAEDMFDDDGQRVYTQFRQDGHDVSGVGGQMPGMEGMPPVWNTYIATDDADASAEAARRAGGSVLLEPMTVMDDVGRMAVFADPAGATISVWQAGTHKGAGLVNEPCSLSWNELLSRDRDGVRGFYEETFGWKFEDQDMGPMGVYVVASVNDAQIAGLMSMPDGVPEEVPSYWTVYFAVGDADATCEQATELGGEVLNGPMDIEGVGRIATIQDAMGGVFNVMQYPDDFEPS